MLARRISIITVVYNGVYSIEKTIKSVISQDYDSFQYIVIDGLSTDGTIDIIKKYSNYIDVFVSEKDMGIYDAMNKGLQYSDGDWIVFLNAGDLFSSNCILSNILRSVKENCDIIYSDVLIDVNGNKSLKRAINLSSFSHMMPFCHQSCLIKNKLFVDKKFNTSYKIAADYDFLLSCYLQNKQFQYFREPIAIFLSGGISYNLNYKYILEYGNIIFKQYYGIRRIKCFYVFIKSIIATLIFKVK